MDVRLSARCSFALLSVYVYSSVSSILLAQQVDMAGVKVRFVDYQGPATSSVRAHQKRALQIEVDPRSEQQPLTLSVELPNSARNTWAADFEVLDSRGGAILVRRSGIEWHKLLIPVPAERSTYVVHAVEPPGGQPNVFPDKDREATEPISGLSATICQWYDGRKAALSIRFDDPHPTHVSKAIPILREYGFRGTFMVNPGDREPNSRRRSDFQEHRAEWEAVARRGDQEFANHSAPRWKSRKSMPLIYGSRAWPISTSTKPSALQRVFRSRRKRLVASFSGFHAQLIRNCTTSG